MRAESAVEPTKSENITVTWRRSAVSCGLDGHGRCRRRSGESGCALLGGFEVGNRAQHFAPMPERGRRSSSRS